MDEKLQKFLVRLNIRPAVDHLTDWVNATCKVEAYSSTTKLAESTAISITFEILNTIGYAKACNPKRK